jgi:hypothetical protein
MKNKWTYLCALFYVCTMQAMAQTKYDKNIIEHGIFLSRKGGDLNYAIDKQKPIYYNYLKSKVLYASAKSENVNIMMEYVNPLKMSYEVSYSSQINPDVTNIIAFMNGIMPVIKSLGFNEMKKVAFEASAYYNDSNGQNNNSAVSNNQEYGVVFNSEELYQLGMLIINHPQYYIKNTTPKTKSKSITESKQFGIELFNNLKMLSDNEMTPEQIIADVKEITEKFINADSYQAATDALVQFEKLKKNLSAKYKEEENKKGKVSKFYSTYDEELIANEFGAEAVDLASAKFMKEYRAFLLEKYDAKEEAYLKKLEDLIKRTTELARGFKEAMELYYEADKCFKIGEIPIAPEDIKDVTIAITIYDVTLNDDMELTVKEKTVLKGGLSLKDYSLLSVDFAAGLLYPFNLSYPLYSTGPNASGALAVSEAKTEKINYSAGMMLNLIFKTKTYPAFPFIQLGFGTGNDAPTVFSGVGLKFIKNISISAGAITGWYKELDRLNVGDPITGDDVLKRDLHYQPIKHPSFYIGIQYSF